MKFVAAFYVFMLLRSAPAIKKDIRRKNSMGKVKVRQRGFEHVQVWTGSGDVRVCGWVWDESIRHLGSLCHKSMYDIYHSENAIKFRESFKDGSYRYCSKESCPWIANNDMESHLIEIDEDYEPDYPLNINLAYEHDCNYKCTCCRTHYYTKKDGEAENIEKIEEELGKFINRVKIISSNGRGELFASKNILRVLHNWKPDNPDTQVILETNGSLFNPQYWDYISHLGKYKLWVAITIMSFENDAYQFLSGTNLDVENVISNLRFVKMLREQGIINHLELATVVQERNIYQLPEFTRRCIEEFGADVVRLRPFYPYRIQKPEFEWFADIRNPKHPYYSEYVRIMSDPIFNHPKVYKWSGNETSKIGTIYEYLKKEDAVVKKDVCCKNNLQKEVKEYECKNNSLKKRNDELTGEIKHIQNSLTYKTGSVFLHIPKKIVHMFK